MSKKALTIRIKLDRPYSKVDLALRQALADTLEEREVGEVYDEGMGENYMEVTIDIVHSEEKEFEIKSILLSLGLLENSEFYYIDV